MMAPGAARAPDVALVMADFWGGGAERMMVRLAQALLEAGRDVELVVCVARGEFTEQAHAAGIPIVELGRPGVAAALPALVGYLRRRRPRTVLVTLHHVSVMVALAWRLAGVPARLVVRQANNPASYPAAGLKDRLAIEALRWILPMADGVMVGSQGLARDLAAWARVDRVRVHVVANPIVDRSLVTLSEEPVDHPFFFAPGAPIVLTAGRLIAPKDFMTLLEAMEIVLRERPMRLVILGEGRDRPALERFVQDHGLQEAVSMPGFVQNPFAYMRRADVFVLSSASEGLPGVLVQAMACGCPVVSTDCPSGPREVLDDGRFGRLVPVGDAAAMADAIISTLDAPVASDRLRARAAEYSVDRAVAATEAVLWPDRVPKVREA
jgi:glycosyltransferase involved in cell wall biosynthesis